MSQQTELVAQFLSSLKSGAAADLLAQDAGFQALNVDLKGKDAVLARFAASRRRLWRRGLDPGGQGRRGAGGRHFAERRQAHPHGAGEGRQDRAPPAADAAGRAAAAGRAQAAVRSQGAHRQRAQGAASRSSSPMSTRAGQPNVTFRGSTQAFSDDQLAIWVRNADGKMLRSIRQEPESGADVSRRGLEGDLQFPGPRPDRRRATRRGKQDLRRDGAGRARPRFRAISASP